MILCREGPPTLNPASVCRQCVATHPRPFAVVFYRILAREAGAVAGTGVSLVWTQETVLILHMVVPMSPHLLEVRMPEEAASHPAERVLVDLDFCDHVRPLGVHRGLGRLWV